MTTDESNVYVNNIKDDFEKVQNYILMEDPSAAQGIGVNLTKVLILTCASCYEQTLQDAYEKYAARESKKYAEKPHRFDIDKSDKSIYQKFNFGKIEDAEDLNQLPDIKKMLEPLKTFGKRFEEQIFKEVSADIELENELRAFQEIFAIRNLIAHNAFIEFSMTKIRGKSFGDIVDLHNKAIKFVEYLAKKFQ